MDLDRLEIGPATPLVQGLSADFIRGADFDVSSQGTLVYRSAPGRSLRLLAWLDAAGRKDVIPLKPGTYFSPRLSPDNNSLALLVSSQGQLNLWEYRFATRTMTQLTFDSEQKCCPIWTPDGRHLILTSGGGLVLVPQDGAGKVERLLSGISIAAWSFSPDGSWLTFHRVAKETGPDPWLAPVLRESGHFKLGEPKALIRRNGLQTVPSISPDGRWVFYVSDETGQIELFVVPFSSEGILGKTSRLVSGGEGEGVASPLWSRNDRKIFFRASDQRLRVISYTPGKYSWVSEVPRIWSEQKLSDTGIFPNFDVSSDGKRIVALLDAVNLQREETHLCVVLNLGTQLRGLAPK